VTGTASLSGANAAGRSPPARPAGRTRPRAPRHGWSYCVRGGNPKPEALARPSGGSATVRAALYDAWGGRAAVPLAGACFRRSDTVRALGSIWFQPGPQRRAGSSTAIVCRCSAARAGASGLRPDPDPSYSLFRLGWPASTKGPRCWWTVLGGRVATRRRFRGRAGRPGCTSPAGLRTRDADDVTQGGDPGHASRASSTRSARGRDRAARGADITSKATEGGARHPSGSGSDRCAAQDRRASRLRSSSPAIVSRIKGRAGPRQSRCANVPAGRPELFKANRRRARGPSSFRVFSVGFADYWGSRRSYVAGLLANKARRAVARLRSLSPASRGRVPPHGPARPLRAVLVTGRPARAREGATDPVTPRSRRLTQPRGQTVGVGSRNPVGVPDRRDDPPQGQIATPQGGA